jgi:hypothetical protein
MIVGGSLGIVAHGGTDDDAMLIQPRGFRLQYSTVGRYLICALYLSHSLCRCGPSNRSNGWSGPSLVATVSRAARRLVVQLNRIGAHRQCQFPGVKQAFSIP